MIIFHRATVLLDACVLYPAPLRDYLLNLADLSLFQPKWTPEIQEEWTRNLLRNRSDLKRKSLQKTVQAMNAAFPDAEIENFQPLIDMISLPDQNDRHVLAAGIEGSVEIIVTFNLKDFPANYLSQYSINAQHPDEFVCGLIDIREKIAYRAFENQVMKLKNPPKTKEEVLTSLDKCGLENTAERLRIII